MSWISVGDWAEEMSLKMQQQRRERLKLAARHFGLDLLDILGDEELEEKLLARYEATGLPWPKLTDEEDDE
jgi:hypothetical protein